MNTEINQKYFDFFPTLVSERLLFRKFSLADSSDLFQIRSNENVMRYMDTKLMESIQDAEKFILLIEESYRKHEGINWLLFEKISNTCIGYFGFWKIIVQHCRAEIGFALKSEFSGKGYMNETMKTMIEFGFNKLCLHSIEANVNPGNLNCIKLLEKNGFTKDAYFRENIFFNNRFVDSIIYTLLESDLHTES